MEYEEMGFLLHLLRHDDLFIDIGANIGTYTILASSEIKARTITIEPVPSTFNYLINNILINKIQDKVEALNVALGSMKGKLKFTKAFDTVNHVATENETNTIEVEVKTLDEILFNLHNPILLKIDVEGFETEVLNGAEKTLANNTLKVIIIELNGSGQRYGYDEVQIHEKLITFGFKPFKYNPTTRVLHKLDKFGSNNTIYLRDKAFIEDRVKNSRKIKIGNKQSLI
jgi:FkbM family methyltransferase